MAFEGCTAGRKEWWARSPRGTARGVADRGVIRGETSRERSCQRHTCTCARVRTIRRHLQVARGIPRPRGGPKPRTGTFPYDAVAWKKTRRERYWPSGSPHARTECWLRAYLCRFIDNPDTGARSLGYVTGRRGRPTDNADQFQHNPFVEMDCWPALAVALAEYIFRIVRQICSSACRIIPLHANYMNINRPYKTQKS